MKNEDEKLDKWRPIKVDFEFDEYEFEQIKNGFEPDKTMDDRWHIFYKDNWLYFNRSWTNDTIYKIKFESKDNVFISTEAYGIGSKSEASEEENAYDVRFLNNLINIYLLNRDLVELLNKYDKLDIDGIHGLNHSRRVAKIGKHICDKNNADYEVVRIFAYLHDSCRRNESIDLEHGKRASDFIRSIQNNGELNINDTQFEQLITACKLHNQEKAESDDMSVQTCWDADRLDLGRLNMIPDPDLLFTQIGKNSVDFARSIKRYV